MGYLIFLFILILLIIIAVFPFTLKFQMQINVLRLKGKVEFQILKFIKFDIKFRIKNGYVYLYHNNKEIKEKISTSNANIYFMFEMINQSYFRQELLNFIVSSNFGYVNDSCITAVGAGKIQLLAQSVMAKIKNNKKSAHIFVKIEPRYNEDIFTLKIYNEMQTSVFDMIYAFLYAKFYTWSYYERKRKFNTKARK